jgi:uncharacterized protein YndB with AHSA1/START domain
MPSATNTVTIHRPVDAVFAYVTDGMNGSKWRSGVLETEHVSGSGLGAVYRQGVKGPGGRRVAADYKVTAFEPGRRMAFEAIAGPVRPTGEFEFAAVDGGTRVTFSLDAPLSGWKALVMGGAVQKTMDAEVNALERLKSVLEG